MESVKSEKVLPVGTFYLLYLHKSQKIRTFAENIVICRHHRL